MELHEHDSAAENCAKISFQRWDLITPSKTAVGRYVSVSSVMLGLVLHEWEVREARRSAFDVDNSTAGNIYEDRINFVHFRAALFRPVSRLDRNILDVARITSC